MMRHNKILGAAIVAALSMGGGTTQAADLKLKKIGATDVTEAPTIARELFPADTPTAIPALPQNGTFETTYTMSTLTADITTPFTVTYTLTGGEWTTDKPQATDFVVDGKPAFPVVFMSESNNSIQFRVNADDNTNKLAKDSTPTLALGGFKVDIDKASFASSAQATLSISLSGSVDDSQTATLVKSGNGASGKMAPGNDNDVRIDVGADGKKFTGSATGKNTAAILGTVEIAYSSPRVKDYTLLTDWEFGGADGVKNGSAFKITGGPFAASMAPSDLVFIDINNNQCAYDAGDLAASVASTTAEWKSLTKAQMESIRNGGAKNICLTVNGTTQINAQDSAPAANLTLRYEHRTDTIDNTGTLRLLKRNGALCTLYNIPDEDAIDQPYIRITNRSGGNGVFLRGSLRKSDGTSVFTNSNLLAVKGIATFKNNATVVLTPDNLQTLATQNGYNPETDRWGRGIMTITSDLSKMEVFGLLRQGSALTNFSKVASGENCGN